MMEKKNVLSVKNLEVWFDNDYDSVKILNNISFEIREKETLGIVGESGCGKTVTSLAIMRLLQSPPARIQGSVKLGDKELLELSEQEMQQVRGNQISMIFQEPMTSLNPVFTIGEQLIEPFMQHQGLSKHNARDKALEMLKMVKIPLPEQRLKEYPYELSGGMRQRVMIAMALACKPQLLIADEPTTALDVTIQAQILDMMRSLQKETGTAIAFITHDLGVVYEMCNKVVVLYCGEVMEQADTKELFDHPQHPYTQGLLSTLPKFEHPGKLPTIPGTVPPAGKFPVGCVFAPRCRYANEKCFSSKPPVCKVSEEHFVRCYRSLEKQEVKNHDL